MIVIILLQRERGLGSSCPFAVHLHNNGQLFFSLAEREPGSSCPFAVHFYIINEVFNRQLSFSVLQIEPPSLLHQPSSATSTAFDVIKIFFGEKPM